jgi:hypothetical protein
MKRSICGQAMLRTRSQHFAQRCGQVAMQAGSQNNKIYLCSACAFLWLIKII